MGGAGGGTEGKRRLKIRRNAETKSQETKPYLYYASLKIIQNVTLNGPKIKKNETPGRFQGCHGQHSVSGSQDVPRGTICLRVLCATWSILSTIFGRAGSQGGDPKIMFWGIMLEKGLNKKN